MLKGGVCTHTSLEKERPIGLRPILGVGPETASRPSRPSSAALSTASSLGRPGLDLAARAMCALASVIALRCPDEQRAWAEGCLRVGVEPASIKEIVLQSAYYAGFPAARTARDAIGGVIDADPDLSVD